MLHYNRVVALERDNLQEEGLLQYDLHKSLVQGLLGNIGPNSGPRNGAPSRMLHRRHSSE